MPKGVVRLSVKCFRPKVGFEVVQAVWDKATRHMADRLEDGFVRHIGSAIDCDLRSLVRHDLTDVERGVHGDCRAQGAPGSCVHQGLDLRASQRTVLCSVADMS